MICIARIVSQSRKYNNLKPYNRTHYHTYLDRTTIGTIPLARIEKKEELLQWEKRTVWDEPHEYLLAKLGYPYHISHNSQ